MFWQIFSWSACLASAYTVILTHFAVVWPAIVAAAPGGIFSFHVPIVLFVCGSVAVIVMFLAFG